MIRTAAILARGLGTRMRRADTLATLNASQAAVASSGMKGMIPIKRPFLEYLLSALADAGIHRVVLVIGPEHDAVRQHFLVDAPPSRVHIEFAIQQEALGTADAVVTAAAIVGAEPFLVLNADNYYPIEAYRQLARLGQAGTVAFDREALIADGHLEAERVRAFAILSVDAAGALRGILEKPGSSLDLRSPAARWVGMNLWAMTAELVDACRRVPRSARGEYELPEAVALALREGVAVRALCMSAPVLDLSHRGDIAAVAAQLASVEPHA